MKTEIVNYIYLHHLTCFLSNFPPNSTICFNDELPRSSVATAKYGHFSSPFQNATLENNTYSSTCYNCLWRSTYLFDEERCMQGEKCMGYLITEIFSVLCIMIGAFGAVTNFLIVIVLRKGSTCAPSLTILLLPLAICDGVNNVTEIFFSGANLLAFGNLNRSANVLRTYYIALVVGYYARTTSMFLAVIITIERYCVVAKPLKAKEWFTVRKTKQFVIFASVLSLIANSPRWFDSKWKFIEKNGDGRILPHHKLPGYDGYPYIVEYSDFGYPFYDKFCELYFIFDFLIPLPTLLFFNYLLYRKVGTSNNNRKKLHITCASHQTEVNTAKMFAIVVIILVLCHILPIIFHGIVGIYELIHRDFGMICMLTIGINSAINFVIYCAFGTAFRNDFKKLIIRCSFIKEIR